MYKKLHERLQRFYASHASDYIYLVALLFALPDMLDMLGAVDFTHILPVGWGEKVGIGIAILRATVGVYIRRMPIPAPSESPDPGAK